MFCPKCGTELAAGASFCSACGNQIAQAPQQSAPAKRARGPIVALVAVLAAAAAITGVGFALGWFGGDNGSVYVASKVVSYNTDGSVKSSTTHDRDEHGNTVELIESRSDDKGRLTEVNRWRYKRDEYGNIEKQTLIEADDDRKIVATYDIELDDKNRCVHTEPDGGGSYAYDYEYHDNGVLKKETSFFDMGEGSRYVTEYEYDERGYVVESRMLHLQNGNEDDDAQYTYEWEFDSKGNPKSCAVDVKKTQNGKTETSSEMYTYECDEYGNILEVYRDDKLVKEYEYVKVDDPSVAVRVTASKHDCL